MAAQPEQFRVDTFTRNINLLAQQMSSGIRGKTSMEEIPSSGNRKFIRQYGVRNGFEQITTRNTNPTAVETARRNRVFTYNKYGTEEFFDDMDELNNLLVEPNSDLMRTIIADGEREFDNLFFDNVLGNALQGSTVDSALTSVALGAGQQIAVNYVESGSATNSRITEGKIRRAMELMDAAEVPTGNRYIALPAFQWHELLRTTNLLSSDYIPNRPVVDGSLPPSIYGFVPVRSERVNSAGGNHSVVCWHADAVRMGDTGYEIHVNEDFTKGHSTRLTVYRKMGIVRLEEVGVVDMLCLAT